VREQGSFSTFSSHLFLITIKVFSSCNVSRTRVVGLPGRGPPPPLFSNGLLSGLQPPGVIEWKSTGAPEFFHSSFANFELSHPPLVPPRLRRLEIFASPFFLAVWSAAASLPDEHLPLFHIDKISTLKASRTLLSPTGFFFLSGYQFRSAGC